MPFNPHVLPLGLCQALGSTARIQMSSADCILLARQNRGHMEDNVFVSFQCHSSSISRCIFFLGPCISNLGQAHNYEHPEQSHFSVRFPLSSDLLSSLPLRLGLLWVGNGYGKWTYQFLLLTQLHTHILLCRPSA